MSERNYYVICDDNCKFESMTKEQIIAAIADATGVVPEGIDVDAAFVTKIKEMNANKKIKWWFGTTAEFNALETKEADTVYILTDDDTAESLDAEIQDLKETVADFTETFSQDIQTVLPLSGGEMTGDIDMGENRIKNLAILTPEQLQEVEYNKDAVPVGTMLRHVNDKGFQMISEWTGGFQKQFVEIFPLPDLTQRVPISLPAIGETGYQETYIVNLANPIDLSTIEKIKFNIRSYGASYDGSNDYRDTAYVLYAGVGNMKIELGKFQQTALRGSLSDSAFTACESVFERNRDYGFNIIRTNYGWCPENATTISFQPKYKSTVITAFPQQIAGWMNKIIFEPYQHEQRTKTFGVVVEMEYKKA